jgi:hypothetical protein
MRIAQVAAAVAAALLGQIAGASAGPIALGQWYTFGFAGVGSPLASTCKTTCENGIDPPSIALPSDAPWTITLPAAGQLIVTDAFVPGDRFSLFDNGGLLGDTSVPVIDQTSSCDNDISACLAFVEISKGIFALGAGDHSLSGTAIQSPFGGGVGYFEVSLVPEPATAALIALPLIVLGGIRLSARAGGSWGEGGAERGSP